MNVPASRTLPAQGGAFMERLRRQTRTHAALQALRSSIAQERRILSVVEYVIYRSVLTPLQAAWLLLATSPRHCDCLALLNALHLKAPEFGVAPGSSTLHGGVYDLSQVVEATGRGQVVVSSDGVVTLQSASPLSPREQDADLPGGNGT